MNQHIHLIGIGGTGMGPLGKVFLEMGWKVSGSDLQTSETTDYLTKLGANIYIGHSVDNIKGADKVAYSSAIPTENVELVAAKEQQIQVFHRSEMWAKLVNENRGIAVAGAHGKTTITSMISWILYQSKLEPTVLIGAKFAPFGPGAKYGNGDFTVAEADESDRSFLRYHPEIAIVTSIEADHLENYNGAFGELVDTYNQFLNNRKSQGVAVLGIDDPLVYSLANQMDNVVTYGFSDEADWCAEIVETQEIKTIFKVRYKGESFGEFIINVPGAHNVSNALAAIGVSHLIGLTVEDIKKPLKSFSGAQRRFEIVGEKQSVLVVDDYAHHPTEISATLKAAREGWNRRIIAIFQPHRYSRTKFLLDDFSKAFSYADMVILTDIYAPPPEKPIAGISSEVLAEKIRESEDFQVHLINNQEDIAEFLQKTVKSNDLVITMGAGPIWKTSHEILTKL